MSTSEVALYRVADMQGQNWPELAIPWRYLSDTHPKHCQRPQIDPFLFSFPLLFFTQICSSIFISPNHVWQKRATPFERNPRPVLNGAKGCQFLPGLSRSSWWWWPAVAWMMRVRPAKRYHDPPKDQCAKRTQVTWWKWRPGWWLSGSLQGDVGREVPQMARVMSEAAT